MDWIQNVQRALNYIEANMFDEELNNEAVAKQAFSSNANFQRIFSIVTGVTVADYIRCRRLTLAGKELSESSIKVIDVALKYGYECVKLELTVYDKKPEISSKWGYCKPL